MGEWVGGVVFDAGEAEAVGVVGGEVGGAEEPVPEGEGDGEVAVDGSGVGVVVVPEVHVGVVDEVLEGSEGDVEVGVGEVADGGVEDAVGEHGFGGEAGEGGEGVEEGAVEDDFEAVEAPVGEPVHVGGAVVDLVDAPEEGDAVEEVVDGPLGEIEEEEEGEELEGEG